MKLRMKGIRAESSSGRSINGIIIEVRAPTLRGVRGTTCIACICDERDSKPSQASASGNTTRGLFVTDGRIVRGLVLDFGVQFGEEEISDVSLATFYVFDKEGDSTSPMVQLVAHGGCGGRHGCGGCGHGCGGCGHGGGCADS